MAQDITGRAGQHHFAGIHHRHAIADPGDRAQIMADIDHRRAEFGRDGPQKIQNMRLRRHVEAGCWLIEKECFRLSRKSHGNRDPLLLATRQFMRITFGDGCRIWQPGLAQKLHDAGGMFRSR